MRILFFCCLITQLSYAQPGFNKGYEFGYYFNYFNDVVVQHDTIIAYGLAQDTAWPYLQGLLVARFDTLGNWLDKILILDTTNNIYAIDKHWGKIIPTADGGCAMTAAALYGRDGVFIKLNRKLELEFAQRYKDTINLGEFLVSPIETPEGYLLYGYYQHEGNAKHDAMIRKVDKQGNLIWRKNFGAYDQNEGFYRAIPLGDSLLLLSGRKAFNLLLPETALPWISAFNYQGELQWEWSSNTNAPFNGIYLARFYPQVDNSWLVYGDKYLGIDPEYGWHVFKSYWVKLNKNFQFQWAKPIGPNNGTGNFFRKEIQVSNGDII